MRVRLGYVAIALKLEKITSSSTVTFATYTKQNTDEKKLIKLKQITLSNLDDLYKILNYTVKNQIHFYRMTSQLIPLATHPDVFNWNYRTIFKKDFERLGEYIRENHIRLDTHPDEFNVINSMKPEVVKNTERNLWHHVYLFEDLNYPEGKMVIHVGSSAGGKPEAIQRFIDNFKSYPKEITNKLMLENDDKTFTASEVLKLCQTLEIPMVLDIHHHNCNNEGEDIEEMLGEIFSTWDNELFPPKVHFSTPRDFINDRKHADFINAVDFALFIEKCAALNIDFDVMLEAKKKDLSLYQLVEDLKEIRPQWKWVDNSTLEL